MALDLRGVTTFTTGDIFVKGLGDREWRAHADDVGRTPSWLPPLRAVYVIAGDLGANSKNPTCGHSDCQALGAELMRALPQTDRLLVSVRTTDGELLLNRTIRMPNQREFRDLYQQALDTALAKARASVPCVHVPPPPPVRIATTIPGGRYLSLGHSRISEYFINLDRSSKYAEFALATVLSVHAPPLTTQNNRRVVQISMEVAIDCRNRLAKGLSGYGFDEDGRSTDWFKYPPAHPIAAGSWDELIANAVCSSARPSPSAVIAGNAAAYEKARADLMAVGTPPHVATP